MNLVVLAFVYDLGYHVVRALRQAGHDVYVLGQDTARGLEASSACAGYREFDYHPDTNTIADAATSIADYVKAVGATAVVPSEVLSTRLLIAVKELLPVRCCLLPDALTFDRLNDKWAFAELCRTVAVGIPHTTIAEDRAQLRRDIHEGRLALPLVLKPRIGMGQKQVQILRSIEALDAISWDDDDQYLAQRFIDGVECGISIVARSGRVLYYAVQSRVGQRFSFFEAPQLLAMIQRLVAETGFEGAANFDVIRENGSGDYYLLECNPRFWYSIFVLNVAGLNMVALCLDPGPGINPEPVTIRPCMIPVRRAIIEDFVRMKWTRGLFAMIAYILGDLRGVLAEHFMIYSDDIPGKGGIADQLTRLDHLSRTTSPSERAS